MSSHGNWKVILNIYFGIEYT